MHFIRPHRPHSAPQLQNILLRDMKLGYLLTKLPIGHDLCGRTSVPISHRLTVFKCMFGIVGAFKALPGHCESPLDSSLVMASHKVRIRW